MSKNRMTEKLIAAFSADNLFYKTVNTNLTLERGTLRDYIVIKFDKDMDYERGMSYMKSLKEKLIKRFFITEDDAGIAFDMRSFPFDLTEGKLQPSKKGIKYVVPVSEGTILNLKCYLMFSFAKDIGKKLGEIFGVEYIDNSFGYAEFDHKYYLYCMYCEDKEVRDKFVELFQSDITSYNNVSSKLFNVEGDYVYIKDVFKNNIPLIDRMIERSFWLEGRYLQVPSSENKYVESMKHRIVSLINAKSSIPFYHAFRASYLDSKENSVFIPIMRSTDGSFRFLTQKEAKNINKVFGYSVLHNIDGCITKKQLVELLGEDCVKGIYGINFYDKETSRYIMSKVIQESVINKDHELSIDPGLRFQALSPAQSPLNSPTHAGPSGLRTPPKQRQEDRDSGIGESPPQLKDSAARSPSGDPRSSVEQVQTQRLPTRSQDGALEGPPREWSEREGGKGGLFQLVPGKIDSSQSTGDQSQLSLGAGEGMLTEDNIPDQKRSSLIPSPIAWNDSTFLNPEVSNEEPEKQQVTKEKEEEKLFKALLYWFNLNNYALDPPHTNFIAENGKIASLIDDGVDVKEYLQEIIDKTKEEYRVNKEEAYDLDEFPFQFLSNCEKNQETTVVANISRGALLNLKELFSREHEGKVEIKDIDINIVEKAVKSEKDEWVNFQVQEHGLSPKKAIKTCYPDESVLEYIPITKDEGGYWINRDYDGSEVESFRGERWPAKDKSKAEKMKSEDNKDSGYSSGFVTDAENVSSKAEATTSGYESMDCENTRGGLPKRNSPEPLAGSSTTKKTRSESDSSSFEGGVGSPYPDFSGSTIEQVRGQLNKTEI